MLKVLVFDLYRHKQLNALVVLHLVARHDWRLRVRRKLRLAWGLLSHLASTRLRLELLILFNFGVQVVGARLGRVDIALVVKMRGPVA